MNTRFKRHKRSSFPRSLALVATPACSENPATLPTLVVNWSSPQSGKVWPLNVNIEVTGTARRSVDYPTDGMTWTGGDTFRFTIPADQLTLPYIIKGNQDGIVESDEIVTFTLTGGDKTYRIGTPETASVTLKDYIEGIFKDSFEDP